MLRALQFLLHTRGIHGRCGICGTRLCVEDAITITASELTHAECFLVHVLEASEHQRPFSDDFAIGDEAADPLWETLVQTLTGQ